MKTSVEISGYTISIEELEGVISVNAVKDDEVVEEFTINIEEGQSEDELSNFGEYDEEEDFEGEESQGEEDDDDDDDEFGSDEEEMDEEENEGPAALESFQSFINKKSTPKRKK